MIVHGIHIMEFPNKDFAFAKLIALAPVKAFENTKVKISGVGFAPRNDQSGNPKFPAIKLDYARMLIDSRAFVSGKDYDMQVDIDDETMESVVVAISPSDPQVKQHFDAALKSYKS